MNDEIKVVSMTARAVPVPARLAKAYRMKPKRHAGRPCGGGEWRLFKKAKIQAAPPKAPKKERR